MKPLIVLGIIGASLMATSNFQINVTQHPEEMASFPSSSVAMICEFIYQKTDLLEIEVSWYKGWSDCHRSSLTAQESPQRVRENLHVHSHRSDSKGYSILVMDDLQSNDSDIYYCEVLLIRPPPARARGNGTRLRVYGAETAQGQHRTGHNWSYTLIALSSAGAMLVLVGLVTLVYKSLCGKIHGLKSKAANEVYEEMMSLRKLEGQVSTPL